MSDIKAEGRELVITKDGRVKRSPVPVGFNPQMFRHIVAGVDLLYRKHGKLPTINEVTKIAQEQGMLDIGFVATKDRSQ